MIKGIIQKKSDWIGLAFLGSLIGLAVLAYVLDIASAALAYPAAAFLAGAFGIGVLVQSIRLTKTSGLSRYLIIFAAIGYFIVTIFAAAENATTPSDVLNGLAAAYMAFMFFWYYKVIYRARLAVDEVHILSVSILAWIFFYGTSSWWWYGTLIATVVALFALLRHGQMPALVRLLLFGWFTAINASLVWSQFGHTYGTVLSIADVGSSPFSSSLILEMFAAGLAAPVALFPLLHAFLILPLAMLIILGGSIRRRVQEFREHMTSITKSVENVSIFDWRVIGVVGGIMVFSTLAIFGMLEKALAVNISYALIGLWISLRFEEYREATEF